ncbi:hypothetical protein [Crateriforma conspicua]|nr:hypothetical protein [Crateriforma conspicua]
MLLPVEFNRVQGASFMRFSAMVCTVALVTMFQWGAVARGQSVPPQRPTPQVVAVDTFVAEALAHHWAGATIPTLFFETDESCQVIAKRAWSMRDASFLVYHSRRLNPTARMYCERLQVQGVRLVDLKDLGVPVALDGLRQPTIRLVDHTTPSQLSVVLRASLQTHSLSSEESR